MTASMRCISCGNPIQDPPELQLRKDGSPCSACRDRVLDALPPALPRRLEVVEEEEELYQGELFDGEDDLAG